MYEVFLNDKKINITSPGKITLNKSIPKIDNLVQLDAVKKWFLEFAKKDIPEIVLLHSNPYYFFENIFQKAFLKVEAAGGIVVREKKVLFIFRNNIWDLPKGKIDAGEDANEAALREVEEECGISEHKIVKPLPSTFHIFQSPYRKTKGQWIIKQTFWFEMKYSGVQNGKPQLEEGITKVEWLGKNELNKVLANTHANLRSLIQLYLA